MTFSQIQSRRSSTLTRRSERAALSQRTDGPSRGHLHFITPHPKPEKHRLAVTYERISTGANTPKPNLGLTALATG